MCLSARGFRCPTGPRALSSGTPRCQACAEGRRRGRDVFGVGRVYHGFAWTYHDLPHIYRGYRGLLSQFGIIMQYFALFLECVQGCGRFEAFSGRRQLNRNVLMLNAAPGVREVLRWRHPAPRPLHCAVCVRNAVIRAASRAALRPEGKRYISMADLSALVSIYS